MGLLVVAHNHNRMNGIEANVRELTILFGYYVLHAQRLARAYRQIVHMYVTFDCDRGENCRRVGRPGDVGHRRAKFKIKQRFPSYIKHIS